MHHKINFLGTYIDDLTMDETLFFIKNALENNQQIIREDLNAAKIVWMQEDSAYAQMIRTADIINADGMSVVKAVHFLQKKEIQRITGIDLMENLIALSHQCHYRIFFLGAKEEVVKKTVSHYISRYSNNIIAGFHNGYYQNEENIVHKINESKADILFIGMNSPKKEYFISAHKTTLNPKLIMGVGGSFDVISGTIQRAPIWMQNAGLEWFYRLIQEPKRMWKRYLYTNMLFIWLIVKEKLSQI